MNRKASALTVALTILILVSLAGAGGAFYLFQKTRNENLKLQEQIKEININLEKTGTELANYKKQNSELELRLKDAQAQIDTLTNDLQQEKTTKQEALKQIDNLKAELEQQKSFKLDLEKKFNAAQEDVKKTQAQLKELESRKTELETKISELETKSKDLEAKVQGIELGTIVIGRETTPPQQTVSKPATRKQEKKIPVSGLEGKVLVVNKDYNFVVINLGTKDGVEMDNVFSVYHGNNYIGDVKIEKIHDSMAAAGFVSGDIKDKVNEGDKVVQKVK